MILLDTNVLIYASTDQSPFLEWARRTIAAGVSEGGAAVNAVSLAEICVGDAEPETVAEEVVITSDDSTAVRLMLVLQAGRENQDARQPTRTVGTALDHFMGIWPAEQEAEVLKAIEVFEQVDESFWY